uniref:L-ornithine N(5)-monooxygenase [NAD(P)H] n=1 Tax=Chromera velia CCMP2878 TaxID=1169474 RepID=A0A0G4F201_9ALVE|eukprot:Cvel_14768.t1-p1 / transcript=Cvel_14768.t1 / gene=Cvel_14768 / organism=Chromera_velia_CCMP2878 / gene_product=Uncharacterized monooxygenase Mb0916, putative / transcript_product=Uncharacterized monooxygenase Mb0916, putative / location=Cvel_scaffold1063:31761-33691(+) / protein_length=560 / sequence_SO=supercontig / SO=protein_coding / is_pseudo=false
MDSSAPRSGCKTVDVLVIGAGFGGICAAKYLKDAGFSDLLIVDKNPELGGTWYENTYPGAACDVTSVLYSFSFFTNFSWSSFFPPQKEIHTYQRETVDKFGLRPLLRLGHTVKEIEFNEETAMWTARCEVASAGKEEKETVTIKSRFVISCVGQLNKPMTPQIEGQSKFAGPAFHTAQWDHSVSLAGKRVAVVGCAASAIQVIPTIQPIVGQLTVFQRTPSYIAPKPLEGTFSEFEKWLLSFSLVFWLLRMFIYLWHDMQWFALSGVWGLKHLWMFVVALNKSRGLQGASPEKRAEIDKKVTPDYAFGCKRLLLSSNFYPAISQPNVSVVTDPIDRVQEGGIVAKNKETGECTLYEADVIVYATGFQAQSFISPTEVKCRGKELGREWREHDPRAYLGILAAGFPNLFFVYGPNTNLGHSSIIFMLECQAAYIVKCLKELRSRKARSVEVREEAADRFDTEVQSSLKKSVWSTGCASWYTSSKSGRVVNNWRGTTTGYWWLTRRLNLPDLVFSPRAPQSSLPLDRLREGKDEELHLSRQETKDTVGVDGAGVSALEKSAA